MGIIVDTVTSILNIFFKFSQPVFSFEDTELKFKIQSDKFHIFPIDNFETKTRHDPFVIDAYTFKMDKIFIEYIHLDRDACWNGQASSYFIELFKSTYNINKLEIVEKRKFKNYEFITYEIDDEFFINFINIFDVTKEILVLDSSSDLYIKLLKSFDSKYEYSFDKEKNFDKDINLSLVKLNAMEEYFSLSD